MANKNIFNDTSKNYSKYRDDYNQDMIDYIVSYLDLGSSGSLLDLGCGTGRVTFKFHSYFDTVMGVDINSEMLKAAKVESINRGINNIRWICSPAEELKLKEKFNLITCGEAFHWMNREKTAAICYDLLKDDGAFVLVGAGGAIGQGNEEWHRVLRDIISKWTDNKREKNDWASKKFISHYDLLMKTKFKNIIQKEFEYTKRYSINDILGFLSTTSYCNDSVLGDKKTAFQKDLTEKLLNINSDNEFTEKRVSFCVIAKK